MLLKFVFGYYISIVILINIYNVLKIIFLNILNHFVFQILLRNKVVRYLIYVIYICSLRNKYFII